MLNAEYLRDRAAKCLRLADELLADAETLRRFGEELTEMAVITESERSAAPTIDGSGLPL